MSKQLVNNDYVLDYNNGLSIWDIAKKHNNTYKNVYESITGHRFEARLLSATEKCRICELYNSGLSTVTIGKMYGVNNKPIAVVLEEFGIRRSQKRFVRKYKVDEEYFDVIDTANKAYVVGFLSADGCNMPSKSTISMSLEESDKEILEEIRQDMKNEHPLEFIDYSKKHDFGYRYKNQYRLLIFSAHMCDTLRQIGVVQNKSLKLEFSQHIPVELVSHYIRGVFDGDGSIGVKNIQNYKGTISVSITSTFNFCKTLQKILFDELNIQARVTEAGNHNGITAALYITKKADMKTFLDWIYQDATLYLKRKYEVYINHYYRTDNVNNSLTA